MTAIVLPRHLRIGGGTLRELPELLADLGLARPFIVSDEFLIERGICGPVVASLEEAGRSVRLFGAPPSDPSEKSVARALEALREGVHDCVVGFGGGSPIDTAKAIAVLSQRGGTMRDLKVPHVEHGPALPIIAIPTTAGTGSEATRFTIVTDDDSQEKMLCAGPSFMPTAAIVDYELTYTKPWRLTADTGIDALTHAIESYVSRKANPFTDALALAAMRAIWPNLRTACNDPQNEEAREALMIGAHQAGIAFSNASVALVHGMSRPISAFFHVPHGLSNAMLLPAVTAFSLPAAPARYADCARAMRLVPPDIGDAPAGEALVHALRQLNVDLEVPGPAAFGIEQIQWIRVRETMAQQALASGSPSNNPRVPTSAEICRIYDEAWG